MKKYFFRFFIFIFLFSATFDYAQAQQSLTLTLTPPLFQITQAPGTEWKSSLRLVNSNHFDIIISIKVRDFHPDGETGNAVIEEVPQGSRVDTHRMSGWIETSGDNITVKRDTTALIPFTIHVPKDADPGGHYATILVGTSPSDIKGGSGAGVSSAISSLLFLRVPGNVIESGSIRDFYSEKSIVQSPESTFVLRFENKGNVHLVPQGQIVITNMWGKERGKIDINEQNTFGNVLPNSTRKFEFKWEGESNPFEVGRYQAVATLVYGADDRKTVYRSAYFWVIPIKPVLAILLTILLFGWFISWSVKRYIRKAISLERQYLGTSQAPARAYYRNDRSRAEPPKTQTAYGHTFDPKPQVTLEVLKRPLIRGALDLKAVPRHASEYANHPSAHKFDQKGKISLYIEWAKQYRLFLAFMLVVILGFSLIGWYFVEVFQSERAFQVEQVKGK